MREEKTKTKRLSIMKTLCLAMLMAVSMQAEAADNDTIVVNKPNRVTVVAGDSLQKILIEGREGDSKYVYRNTVRLDDKYVRKATNDKDKWDILPSVKIGNKEDSNDAVSMHLAFGFTNPTGVDKRVDFSTFRSWEIWWVPVLYEHHFDKLKQHSIELGLGVDWRNYRTTDQVHFYKNNEGRADVMEAPASEDLKFSRIKVTSVTASLVYNCHFSKNFGIGLGPVLNWNFHSSVKTKYKEDGKTCSVAEKKVGHRPFTVDFMGLVHLKPFSLYVKYSPNDVIKDGGVEFRSLSFGIYL